MVHMEQAHFLFPDTVVQFSSARRSGRTARSGGRLSGDGLADRLRHDVERHIAHRRRMLEHLQSQQLRHARTPAHTADEHLDTPRSA